MTQSYWTDDLTWFLEHVKGGLLEADDLSKFDELASENIERAKAIAEVIAKYGPDDLKLVIAGSEHLGEFDVAADMMVEDGLAAPLSSIPDQKVPIEALLENEDLPEGAALSAALRFVEISQDEDADLEGEYGMVFKAFAKNRGLSDRAFQNLTRIDVYGHGNGFVTDALNRNAAYQTYISAIGSERGGSDLEF